MNFEDLYLFVNVLSVKFGGVASFGGTIGSAASNLQKFLHKSLICHWFVIVFHYIQGFIQDFELGGGGWGGKETRW